MRVPGERQSAETLSFNVQICGSREGSKEYMDFDIKKFEQYRENNCLEVKKAGGGLPNSLWDTYSAMANCYGGIILLGVAENEDGSFSTTGLRDVEKLRK